MSEALEPVTVEEIQRRAKAVSRLRGSLETLRALEDTSLADYEKLFLSLYRKHEGAMQVTISQAVAEQAIRLGRDAAEQELEEHITWFRFHGIAPPESSPAGVAETPDEKGAG